MKPTAYVETSVVSYLTGRPSRDVVVAGRQEVTRGQWATILRDFDVYVSALVVREAAGGDPGAAVERTTAVDTLPVLGIDERSERLAAALLAEVPMPGNIRKMRCTSPWLR